MAQRDKAELLQEKRQLLEAVEAVGKRTREMKVMDKESSKEKAKQTGETDYRAWKGYIKTNNERLDALHNRIDAINKKLGIEPTLK